MDFTLHPSLDPKRLADRFTSEGRVQIMPFLCERDARALLGHLEGRRDWRLVLNAGEKVYELDCAGQTALTDEQRDKMEHLIREAAKSGFQYRFESIRVSDDEEGRTERGTSLDQFATFLSTGPVRELFRTIVGKADIGFADAQATRYAPGHFLTVHDDYVEGKHRRAAYVLGLTPNWRAEWGGLLMFHEAGGDIARALLPRMNALNLFAVPQPHSVSLVAPFAAAPRYSVTGWLRARR